MGNTPSQVNDSEWKFVGREKDIEEIKTLLPNKRCILISGLKDIGKSKVIKEVYRQQLSKKKSKCIWKDFDLDDPNNEENVFKWFHDFGICIQKDESIKNSIKKLIDKLKTIESETVLFLDNVDHIMKSALKDDFLHFLKQTMRIENTKVRLVIASSTKPKFTEKGFKSYELELLNDDSICEILFETCERRDSESDNDDEDCEKVSYKPEHIVFRKENERLINAIVRLCEGLPLAAIMSGLLLTEDDGLITPANLVEILICMRLKGLSPDNCPLEDRLENYKDSMEDVQEVQGVTAFFNCLNERLEGNTFDVGEAVEVATETEEGVYAEAMVKQKLLKPNLDRCVISAKKVSGVHQFYWHGILRECQADLKILDNISPGGTGDDVLKEMVWKFMKENATKAGLPIDEEILRNPALLEQEIKNLFINEFDSSHVQATDEKKILSISDENSEASKELMHDVQTTVTNEFRDKELIDDDENDPETNDKSSKKREFRYQNSEEFEDMLDFNVKHVHEKLSENATTDDTNGTHNFFNEQILDNPPPYTPKAVEQNATFNIHGDSFHPLSNQQLVRESPPPSYHSYANNHHNSDAHNNTRRDTFNKQGTTSESSRVRSYSVKENVTEHNARHAKYSNRQIYVRRRPRSDPSWDRTSFNNEARKEMDIQGSDSLTGPPGLTYIPPAINRSEINDEQYSDYQGERLNNRTSEAATSAFAKLQLDTKKEELPFRDQINVATTFSVDSTVGPQAMSYKFYTENDLHSDQGNRYDLENGDLTPNSFTHDQSTLDSNVSQNNVHNESRLSVKDEENAIPRRSPTAIVSPMPRRNSPPNVTKQMQSERPVQNVKPFR